MWKKINCPFCIPTRLVVRHFLSKPCNPTLSDPSDLKLPIFLVIEGLKKLRGFWRQKTPLNTHVFALIAVSSTNFSGKNQQIVFNIIYQTFHFYCILLTDFPEKTQTFFEWRLGCRFVALRARKHCNLPTLQFKTLQSEPPPRGKLKREQDVGNWMGLSWSHSLESHLPPNAKKIGVISYWSWVHKFASDGSPSETFS